MGAMAKAKTKQANRGRRSGRPGGAKSAQQTEAADWSESRWLAASHDLRQPLQTLKLLQEILEPHVMGEEGRRALVRMGQALETMDHTLTAIFDIDRLPGRAELVQPAPAKGPPAAEAAASPPAGSDTTFAAATIFVVDDDRAARESMRILLTNAGYKVRAFAGAEIFLESHRAEERGCLITDVRMPGLNGLEMLAQLAAKGSKLPTIVITGRADVSMAVQAMRAGAADFIAKPIDAQALLASVKRALRQTSNPAERSAPGAAAAMRVAGLTKREREVMTLIAAGRANKEIAAQLGITRRTVETHRAMIMIKLRVKSLADLVRLAVSAEETTYPDLRPDAPAGDTQGR
jgi:FixJ family two-component response regulator